MKKIAINGVIVLCLFVIRILGRGESEELVQRGHLRTECEWDDLVRPVVYENETTYVNVSFNLFRFIELNEVKQKLAFSAMLSFFWYDSCVKDHWKSPNLEQLLVQARDIWRVPVLHISSVSNIYTETNMATESLVTVHPNGLIKWSIASRFDIHCQLKFGQFPYDTQTCVYVMEFLMDTKRVQVTKMESFYPDDFISPTNVWVLNNVSTRLSSHSYSYHPNIYFAQPAFVFHFSRKPAQYVCEIYLPSFALIILQLAFIFMKPKDKERPLYCATVMMSFLLEQNLLQTSIPWTSEVIRLIVFVTVQLYLSVFCTVYSLLACTIARRPGLKKFRIHLPLNVEVTLSLIRLVDFVIFGILVVFAIFMALSITLLIRSNL